MTPFKACPATDGTHVCDLVNGHDSRAYDPEEHRCIRPHSLLFLRKRYCGHTWSGTDGE